MRTIITHFYNEEFLLPLWLKHHKQYFDHGVLIDYGSTDNSVEIIKKICPTWQIFSSLHEVFDHELCDNEVMFFERQFQGWRISIPVTEFIVGDVDALTQISDEKKQILIPVIVFASYDPDGVISNKKPLWEQTTMAIPHEREYINRSIHNFNDITYPGGRHFWGLGDTQDAMIFKFSSCLIGKDMIDRRLQMYKKISEKDKILGYASQHMITKDTVEMYYRENIESKIPVDCSNVINRMIEKSKGYSIHVFSNKPHKFSDIKESINPEIINYYDGSNAESFSKIVNSCAHQASTETVILCSDKFLPTQNDIKKILKLLDEGYALVAYHKFACFGFRKELFRKIGPFDERFLSGGYEDFDFCLRCREANLAVYLSDEGSYQPSASSWDYSIPWEHWCKKWIIHGHQTDPDGKRIVERVIPEMKNHYDFGPKTNIGFLPGSKSHIKINQNTFGHSGIFQWIIKRSSSFSGLDKVN